MRIISGRHKGKKLVGPPDAKTTRPIPDRVKLSVFNLLRGHFEGAHVVDLFAGTGSIGLEAASRGAARVLMVEKDRGIARVLGRNLESVGSPPSCEVYLGDALGPGVLTRCPRPVNLLFADPPYAMVRDPEGWRRVRGQFMRLIDLLAYDGFAVLRTPHPLLHRADATPRPGGRTKKTAGIERPAEPARIVAVDLDASDGDEIDDFEREIKSQRHGPKYVDVDLIFENAEGPETHVYGSTAVHLYMRKKDG